MTDVYEYADYRKFIQDKLAYSKEVNRAFTYRFIASQVGFKSPGFLTQIIQAKTRLPRRFIIKLADVLGLKKRETRYFELMVHYCQAKTHDEKKGYFEKMMSFRKALVSALDPGLYAYYDKWYYSAIRAVLQFVDFRGDYKNLSKYLVPSITPAEAKKAIKVLEQLNLISKTDNGSYRLNSLHITSGKTSEAIVINNFVINTLEIAKNAFYKFSREQRSFSALTLGISEGSYKKIRNRIDEFRKEVVGIVREDKEVDRVYQMNIQLFPMSKIED